MKKYLQHLFGIGMFAVFFCTNAYAQAPRVDTILPSVTVCKASLPYIYAGKQFFLADFYEVWFKGSKNQDSVCHFSLNVIDNPEKTVRKGACEDVLSSQGVVFNGKKYYKAGVYEDTVKAQGGGCDTIVTLLVDSYTTYKDTVRKTYCYGTTENGITYNWTGTKISSVTYKTHFCQCDSIVYTQVTVNPVYNKHDDITICENALPYDWRGLKNLFSTKDDTVRLYAKNGCDSIFTIRFTVTPSFSSSDYQVVCPDALKKGFKYGDKTFYSAEIDNVTFKAQNGCDSVVTVKISEGKSYTEYRSDEVCENKLPYFFPTENGLHKLDSVKGVVLDTARYTTIHGCDSIIYLKLKINPAKKSVVNAEICDKDLPFRFAGQDITRPGEHKFNYPTREECDSTVILNLTINRSYVIDTNITICSDILPFVYQNDTMNENGLHTLSYKTTKGCDSIIRVHLTIHNTAKEAVEITVCENDFPYTHAGQTFNDEGYFTVNLKTIHNCDSIIALHIHKRLIPPAPTIIYGPDKIGKEGDYIFCINQVDSFYPITKYAWSVPDGCTIVNHNREEDTIWVNFPDNMGLNEGEITVYAYNECGRSAAAVKLIKTYIKCTIRVYPNPIITNGEVTIEFNDMVGKNVVRITDATGRILHQEEVDIKDYHEEIKFPVGDFASGEYFVRVQTKEMAILKKIVVLKEAAATK